VRYDSAATGGAKSSRPGPKETRKRRPVPGDLTSAGRRVAGNRAEERERRLKTQRTRARLRIAAVALAVVLVVAGLVSLYRSDLFAVRRVDVVGAARLTAEEVRSLAAIPADATLLRLPLAAIEQRLERNAWVSSAEVARDFPDGVRIRITERSPVAIVDAGGSALWQVDRSGVWLAPYSAEASAGLVVIRDVEGLDPVPGRQSRSETLINAIEIAGSLDEGLRPVVKTIVAPSIDRTALITSGDVEVVVGSSDEIARKQEVARKILEQQAGKVVYINVRTVERPTWRGIENTP